MRETSSFRSVVFGKTQSHVSVMSGSVDIGGEGLWGELGDSVELLKECLSVQLQPLDLHIS